MEIASRLFVMTGIVEAGLPACLREVRTQRGGPCLRKQGEVAHVSGRRYGPEMTDRWPIRRLALGGFLSSVGSWAAGIAVSYYVFRETGSAVWVAATLFFTFGVVGLFSPLAGKIADRYDR